MPLLPKSTLLKALDARNIGWPDSAVNCSIIISAVLPQFPSSLSEQVFVPFLILIPRMTNDRKESCERTSKLYVNSEYIALCFRFLSMQRR